MVCSWREWGIIIVNYSYTFSVPTTCQTQLSRERKNTIVIPCIIYAIVLPVLYSQRDIEQFSDFVTCCLLWEAEQELGGLVWLPAQSWTCCGNLSKPLCFCEPSSKAFQESSISGGGFTRWLGVALPFLVWNSVIGLMELLPLGGEVRCEMQMRCFPLKPTAGFKSLLPNVTSEGKGWQICKWELIMGGYLCVHLHTLPPPPKLQHYSVQWIFDFETHVFICHLHSGSNLWYISQENNVR